MMGLSQACEETWRVGRTRVDDRTLESRLV
jgi:hypothetical protein